MADGPALKPEQAHGASNRVLSRHAHASIACFKRPGQPQLDRPMRPALRCSALSPQRSCHVGQAGHVAAAEREAVVVARGSRRSRSSEGRMKTIALEAPRALIARPARSWQGDPAHSSAPIATDAMPSPNMPQRLAVWPQLAPAVEGRSALTLKRYPV